MRNSQLHLNWQSGPDPAVAGPDPAVAEESDM